MIEVRHLSKVFRLPHAKKRTLYHNIISTVTQQYDYEEFYALKDMSFAVHHGEFVGIIGKNGSGKSTLLKILANIFKPTTGEVIIQDRVFPLLELGVGFQADFSVRDNIYLYGALLGFSRTEMTGKVREILEFAELERFADTKLQRLSTGMQMRLGFAIAIQSFAPIMLVDEVLAVGDLSFVEKCFSVFADFKRRGTTVLLVSHDLGSIEQLCDRVLVVANGELLNQGDPKSMIEFYSSVA